MIITKADRIDDNLDYEYERKISIERENVVFKSQIRGIERLMNVRYNIPHTLDYLDDVNKYSVPVDKSCKDLKHSAERFIEYFDYSIRKFLKEAKIEVDNEMNFDNLHLAIDFQLSTYSKEEIEYYYDLREKARHEILKTDQYIMMCISRFEKQYYIDERDYSLIDYIYIPIKNGATHIQVETIRWLYFVEKYMKNRIGKVYYRYHNCSQEIRELISEKICRRIIEANLPMIYIPSIDNFPGTDDYGDDYYDDYTDDMAKCDNMMYKVINILDTYVENITKIYGINKYYMSV